MDSAWAMFSHDVKHTGRSPYGAVGNCPKLKWKSLIGLRMAIENQERFSRIVLSNGGLPTGEQQMPDAFLRWREFSRTAPKFDIARSIGGTGRTEEGEQDAVAGNNKFIFTPNETNTGVLKFRNISTATDFSITNLSVRQTGIGDTSNVLDMIPQGAEEVTNGRGISGQIIHGHPNSRCYFDDTLFHNRFYMDTVKAECSPISRGAFHINR